MKHKFFLAALVLTIGVLFETGCATKKYVRERVAERVQPLENRTTELEETSRRNTQQIGELRSGIEEVRGQADRAQQTADRAASAAEQANTRLATIEGSVEDLRSSMDQYTLQNTTMVFFRPGSSTLTPEAMAQLDMLASQITDRNGFVLEIVGYGDTERATPYNQSLAEMRAQAVQRYFADKANIPVMRMYALGFGAARPVTQNVTADATANGGTATPSSRALYRRVEIRLLTNNAVPSAPMQRTRTTPNGTTSNN